MQIPPTAAARATERDNLFALVFARSVSLSVIIARRIKTSFYTHTQRAAAIEGARERERINELRDSLIF